MSLRLRLALTYSALVALVLVTFGGVLFISMRQALEEEMDHRLEVRATQVRLTIRPGIASLTADDLIDSRLSFAPLALLDTPTVYVQVVGGDGELIQTSESLRGESMPIHDETVRTVLSGRALFSHVEVDAGQTIRMLSVPIRMDGRVIGVLQVGQSLQPLEETLAGLGSRLQLLGVGAILIAGVVGWLVAHRGLRDLIAMSQQAASITTHRDFGRRLRLERRDEV